MTNPDSKQLVPKVVIGSIGTGIYVENLESFIGLKKLIGFDMETFSILKSMLNCMKIVVKSVANFGNQNNNNRFDGYASHTSAAFLLHIILNFFQENTSLETNQYQEL